MKTIESMKYSLEIKINKKEETAGAQLTPEHQLQV